jgi:hypothetical protein
MSKELKMKNPDGDVTCSRCGESRPFADIMFEWETGKPICRTNCFPDPRGRLFEPIEAA